MLKLVPVVRSLEQLLVSLQWGRQQTYYPSAQPLSTGEMAAANHKLADAINSHLLGSSSVVVKSSTATAELLCTTPAEKMAEKVRTPYPCGNLTIHLTIVDNVNNFACLCSVPGAEDFRPNFLFGNQGRPSTQRLRPLELPRQ